jgi:hypothetical protein
MRFANIKSRLVPNIEPYSAGEVGEQLQTNSLAFFRMKLHSIELAIRYNRWVTNSIVRLTHDHLRIVNLGMVGVNEVEEGLILNL